LKAYKEFEIPYFELRRVRLESRRGLISKLVNEHGNDERVLGIVQVGSTVKGYADEHSDVDLEMVVTEDRYAELAKNSQKILHTEQYDLIFTTISKLQEIKDSDKDEDHWNYQNSVVLLDKTHTLREILNGVTRYDEASRLDRLKRHYGAYWENTLSAWSCLEHNNQWGARIYTALTVQELVRLLFNFNHLWSPRLQWAFKEIGSLQKKPEKLEAQLMSILEQPETAKLSRLWNETTALLREENYTWVDHPEELL
jgi:predicted nucleotidyltransferase